MKSKAWTLKPRQRIEIFRWKGNTMDLCVVSIRHQRVRCPVVILYYIYYYYYYCDYYNTLAIVQVLLRTYFIFKKGKLHFHRFLLKC